MLRCPHLLSSSRCSICAFICEVVAMDCTLACTLALRWHDSLLITQPYIYTYIKLTFTYIPVHLTTTYTHRTPLPELRHATAPTACSINDALLEPSVRGRLRPMPALSCAHPHMYMHVFAWLTTMSQWTLTTCSRADWSNAVFWKFSIWLLLISFTMAAPTWFPTYTHKNKFLSTIPSPPINSTKI